jgi:hypothetical protein
LSLENKYNNTIRYTLSLENKDNNTIRYTKWI